jgi:hypothetical protein
MPPHNERITQLNKADEKNLRRVLDATPSKIDTTLWIWSPQSIPLFGSWFTTCAPMMTRGKANGLGTMLPKPGHHNAGISGLTGYG